MIRLVNVLVSLLSPLAWLVYPVVVPVPALLILVPTAWGTVRWSRRRREEVVPAPAFTQVWAWIGWGLVCLFAFIIIGLAVLGWQAAVMVAVSLVIPLGVSCSALLGASRSTRVP